jgi:phosphoribosylformylglycinamidine synthase
MIQSGAVHHAHDIAEGGLAVALAECCVASDTGATLRLPDAVEPFAEAPGRAFIVSGPEPAVSAAAAAAAAPVTVIGRVGGDQLEIESCLKVAVSELREAREHGLEEFL